MGKRQLGELQPVEFVITLVVAELACVPMQDVSTPILYGIVPIFVIFAVHFLICILSSKSIWFRKVLNGKPVEIINENGIDTKAIEKLNMNVNDVLESLREKECFSLDQVLFAIVETTGRVSVLANTNAKSPNTIPITLIVDGKYIKDNLSVAGTSQERIDAILEKKRLVARDILLMTIEERKIIVQPYGQKYFTENAGFNYES
jgi:uncharacterized membrane protein YcaP (DUF421 family)